MASGVNDAFPLAVFVHASSSEDIKPHRLEEIRTILLVDPVVNHGKAVTEFVSHIHSLAEAIPILATVSSTRPICHYFHSYL